MYDERLELLSAYLDGEVTPDEAAAVEEWLAESDETRREFEELKQLSGLLKQLPPIDAPEELAAAVMRRAEREMLLGRPQPAHSAPEPLPQVKGAAPAVRRGWIVAFAGVFSSAAALVLAAWLMMDIDEPMHRPSEVAIHGSAEPGFFYEADRAVSSTGFDADESAAAGELRSGPASGPQTWNNAPASAPTNGVRGNLMQSPAIRPDVAAKKSSESGGASMAAATSVPASQDKPPAEALAGFGTAKRESQQLQSGKELKQAQVGDFFRYLEQNADGVTVVEVTVVDVKEAVNSLQLLLAENRIPQLADRSERFLGESEKGSAPAPSMKDASGGGLGGSRRIDEIEDRVASTFKSYRRPADAEEQRSSESAGLIAVYVESTPDRLAAALEQISERNEFAQLQPQLALVDGGIDGLRRKQQPESRAARQQLETTANADANRTSSRAIQPSASQPGVISRDETARKSAGPEQSQSKPGSAPLETGATSKVAEDRSKPDAEPKLTAAPAVADPVEAPKPRLPVAAASAAGGEGKPQPAAEAAPLADAPHSRVAGADAKSPFDSFQVTLALLPDDSLPHTADARLARPALPDEKSKNLANAKAEVAPTSPPAANPERATAERSEAPGPTPLAGGALRSQDGQRRGTLTDSDETRETELLRDQRLPVRLLFVFKQAAQP